MNSLISGFCVAFSMYSFIPMPQLTWDKKTMRYALCFLPFVGVLIGACQYLWFLFCTHFEANTLFYAIGATLLPVLISGGIHLDGLTDTSDALGSHSEPERRLEIMKDPHVGAFGVLGMVVFLMCETALFAQLYETPNYLFLALCGFTLARIVGGRAIVSLPCAKNTGLAYIFAENSEKERTKHAMLFELIAAFLALVVISRSIWVVISIAAVILWCIGHARLCQKRFGGITGDLAGFLISTTELLLLLIAVIGGLCA